MENNKISILSKKTFPPSPDFPIAWEGNFHPFVQCQWSKSCVGNYTINLLTGSLQLCEGLSVYTGYTKYIFNEFIVSPFIKNKWKDKELIKWLFQSSDLIIQVRVNLCVNPFFYQCVLYHCKHTGLPLQNRRCQFI